MKLIYSFVVLVILCVGIQLSCGEELKCFFKDQGYHVVRDLYSCLVRSLDNPCNNIIITGSIGVHFKNKNDSDVKAIIIHDTNTKFIPANLGTLFNLKALILHSTDLFEIKSIDFHGMQELEYLNLWKNQLISLPVNVLSNLPLLRVLILNWNKIQELQNGLFDNNLNLEEIYLRHNEIKFIGSGLFDDLINLNYIDAENNVCMNKEYRGALEINQLKNDIKVNCMSPMEVQLYKMEKIIKNLEQELLEDKNDINKEQQKIIEALSKCENKSNKLDAKLQELTSKLYKCEISKHELIEHTSMPMCHESFNINCVFHIEGDDYSCDSQGLTINHRDMELIEVVGTHRRLRSNQNVTELVVTNSTTSFWSHKVFKTFPALQSLYIHNSQLKELIKGDFSFASKLTFLEVHGNEIRILGNQVFEGAEEHLTEIVMNSNQIETILINTFQGLKQLKKLSLKDNLISKFQTETFKELINLQTLNLASNKLQTLDGKLLQFNKKLRYLYLQQNNINGIGEEILNYSLELKTVDFSDNKCIDEKAKGKDDVDSIVDDIKTHCNLFGTCGYLSSIMDILI